MNVTGYVGNMTTHLDLKKYLPDNVTFADDAFDGRVNVTVQIEKEEASQITIDAEDVLIRGLPTGLEGELAEESVTVLTVRGLAAHIEALSAAEIIGRVDAEEFMTRNGLTLSFCRESMR